MDIENQAELKKQETLEAIGKLCLFDDNLMTLVFDRNIEVTELLLNENANPPAMLGRIE